ncbi:NADP-dependent aldehyde dehydrogenase [Jejuia pallidilutea]|uniref:NADP-dependent aldehyde dehydrogenase n=1 Tax=Jejuia pallidilutea TaxID=504487 RepID=A0A362X3M0_9FLAO|nr:aldehyde dehydrogenase (NADP(+)) [Jejuia pallidilutea]PQV51488.1 NADP-dependent aldehyde dehydrogenase [Jejuia pallidilutea]
MKINEITGNSFISGKWTAGEKSTFKSYHAVTHEALYEIQEVNEHQITSAVNASYEAYLAYKDFNLDKRAEFLNCIADCLEDAEEELLPICDLETGLGLPRLKGELGRTCGQLRAFAALVKDGSWQKAVIDTAIPERTPLPKQDIRKVFRPLGPVAVFSASNFPLAFSTLGGDTASALAAGNSVVLKGHPSHPATTEVSTRAVVEAMKKCDIPLGVFSMLQGASNDLSTLLVKAEKLEAVGFTGSTRVGRILYDLAASREKPIPVYAEMGSSNPLFVLPNALEKNTTTIAQNLAASITLGTGQFCTKPGLIFVPTTSSTKPFLEALNTALEATTIGNFLNKNIADSFKNSISHLQSDSKINTLLQADKKAILTIKATDFIENPKFEEEIFGPAALVITCENMEDMKKAAKNLTGHLTGTIHTDNDEDAFELQNILEQSIGRIIYNGFPTGVEVCHAMHHGGPYPSSTFSKETSVGTTAIERFCRVVCYQSAPQENLPEALQNKNTRGIMRLINGKYTTDSID